MLFKLRLATTKTQKIAIGLRVPIQAKDEAKRVTIFAGASAPGGIDSGKESEEDGIIPTPLLMML